MKLLSAITGGTELGTLEGVGPLGQIQKSIALTDSLIKFTSVFSTALGVLSISAGIWFIIQILAGSFQWLNSGGDKQGVENARKRISNAIMGLFLVIAAYALISLVGLIFGIDILAPAKTLLGITGPTSGSPSPIKTIGPPGGKY